MEQLGARLHMVEGTPLEAELAARWAASDLGRAYISPYNDADVIAGQGTIAAELCAQIPQIDAIYIAVGGGGLISGVGSYCEEVTPETQMIACWAENSHVMYDCLQAGEVRDFPEKPTVSEGTAGGVEPGSITFEICRRVIDRHVFVTEDEILEAMRWAHARGWMLEGAAGLALAAAFRDAAAIQGKTVVVVACGGNTSPEVLALL